MTENHVQDNYDYCPVTLVDNDGPNVLRLGDSRKEVNDINGLVNFREYAENYS